MAFAGGAPASLAELEARLTTAEAAAAAAAAAAAGNPNFYSDTGPPAPGLGKDGDHYADLANGLLYKKAGGAWTSTTFQLWAE